MNRAGYGRNRRRLTGLWPAGLALLLLGLAACGRSEPPAPPPKQLYAPGTQVSTPTPDEERAADASAAVASCSRQCADGMTATIQCPTGEAAVCNCNADPRARCEPVPPPKMGLEPQLAEPALDPPEDADT